MKTRLIITLMLFLLSLASCNIVMGWQYEANSKHSNPEAIEDVNITYSIPASVIYQYIDTFFQYYPEYLVTETSLINRNNYWRKKYNTGDFDSTFSPYVYMHFPEAPEEIYEIYFLSFESIDVTVYKYIMKNLLNANWQPISLYDYETYYRIKYRMEYQVINKIENIYKKK